MMKRIIIAAFANLFLVSGFSQNFWEVITTLPDSTFSRCIDISLEGDIYLGMTGFGYPGGIYRSTDNAQTWQYLGLDEKPIYALEVCSNGDIIAGVYSGIFKSSDSGNSWYEVYYSSGNITQITSLTNGYVFAGGVDNLHGIIRSTDFGETWDTVHVFTNFGQENLKCITSSSQGHIWAGTYNMFGHGSITYSTDLGETWSKLDTPDFTPFWPWLFSLAIHPEGDLFAGFYGQGLYRYSFTTQDWTPLYYPWVTPDDILIIGSDKIFVGFFQDPNGYVGIAYSDDGGQIFEPLNSGMNGGNGTSIGSLLHHPNNLIYAEGLGFYRSVEPVTTGMKEPTLTQVLQTFNYPNPFSTKTLIQWNNFTGNENVMLVISDATGKPIFNKEVENSGKFIFQNLNFLTGVFYYSVIGKDHLYSGKMVLIK
ncbi:MAG: T9SS type A sorting domain-containing protein [Bacteroidales bacterium]